MISRWLFASLALGLALSAAPAWAGTASWTVPPEIAAHFTPEDLARGQAYMDGRYWLFAAGTALRLAALACLIFTPASASLRNLAVRLSPAHPAVAVAIYIALLELAFELLTLPLGYYSGFVREHAFGLSTQTGGAWLLDRAKETMLSLILVVPLGSLLTLLWRRYPDRWLLPAWTLGGAIVVLLVALAPVVIDPLFNTIRPVQDSALRQRVLALAQRAEIPVEEVYEADASRRTRKGNAYFTGLGATKRIVLYDTLITQSDPEAVELVLAHEMGHWAHAHIWKGIALTLVGMGFALWCGARRRGRTPALPPGPLRSQPGRPPPPERDLAPLRAAGGPGLARAHQESRRLHPRRGGSRPHQLGGSRAARRPGLAALHPPARGGAHPDGRGLRRDIRTTRVSITFRFLPGGV